MARLMLRGPKRSPAPKKMMASPTTIIKSSAPTIKLMAPVVKPSAPVVKPSAPSATVKPSAPVPSFTERLQMMAAKTTLNKPKVNKDLKPEPASPVSITMDKPKRKVPAKRSAAIRKVKKPVAAPKKK